MSYWQTVYYEPAARFVLCKLDKIEIRKLQMGE